MFGYFISGKRFDHKIVCFCPDAIHANVLTINKGDVIEVTNNRKFMMDHGWCFLVKFNNQGMFYMAIEDLEYYVMKERLFSMLDIDLNINYLNFKINQSLEVGDKASFINFTKNLNELSDLKVIMEEYLYNAAYK